MDTKVAVTRCPDYQPDKVLDAVARQFELLGSIGRFVKPGDNVLIKPNFIAPRSRRHATQTHPAVVLAAARLLKDFGARPFVGDSPAWSNITACVSKLGLTAGLARLGVPVVQLNRPRWCEIGSDRTRVGLSTVALEADAIINLPKFKSHQQLVATFAVKNIFGCVTGKRKALWHFTRGKNVEQFAELLIGIYEFVRPAVTIIDGIAAMDGQGPIRGRDRMLGWLIGGTDPIACERICCELVGMQPAELPIVRTAERLGFGCHDRQKIQVLGDDYSNDTCTDFRPAELIPVRFSLWHVCKSIAKQLLLLARTDRTHGTPDARRRWPCGK